MMLGKNHFEHASDGCKKYVHYDVFTLLVKIFIDKNISKFNYLVIID